MRYYIHACWLLRAQNKHHFRYIWMMKKHIWAVIPDLEIHGKPAPYPVLNERAIRATAWLMFMIGFGVMMYTLLTKDRTMMYWTVPIFWLHFFIVTLFGPHYAPFSLLWKRLVYNQRPEYVWAIQKRFARWIWLMMASLMMLIVFVFDIRSGVPLIICSICLLFMWLESAVWLCVWCKIYYQAIRYGIITEPDHRPACPWGVCDISKMRSRTAK